MVHELQRFFFFFFLVVITQVVFLNFVCFAVCIPFSLMVVGCLYAVSCSRGEWHQGVLVAGTPFAVTVVNNELCPLWVCYIASLALCGFAT